MKILRGTLHEDLHTFVIAFRSILLTLRNVLDEDFAKIKRDILCSVTFSVDSSVCEIMWKNIVQPGRPQMTIWPMRISSWVPKSKNEHSEYAVLTDFLLQKLLQESVSVLCYTYIAGLVYIYTYIYIKQ